VSGVDGECTDVTACASPDTALLGGCDSVPSIQCCLPDAILCSVDGAPGLCLPSAECPRDLELTSGLCPGDADVQCCTDPARACDPDAAPTPNEGLVEVEIDPACPPGMITAGDVCVDRYEASLVVIDGDGNVVASHSPYVHPSVTVRAVSIEGAVPQGYIDADTAEQACAAANKRLCTDDEWLRACRGPSDNLYPFGDRPQPGTCNDARASHPAIEYFGTADPSVFAMLGHPCILQVPNGIQTTGAHPSCVTEDGALDMMGNLHEWTAHPDGTFRGGFFVDTVLNGPGCSYVTTAHNRPHWDYSTGFRCCADP
jgi:sulfatase modifying factor 1